MAFSNLRHEIENEEQQERFALIENELKRLARLLNEMLNASKYTPEKVSRFDLNILISDLVTLVRYQIPENINLQFTTPDTLFVYLPESGLRQALLNLVLNSAQALDGKTGRILISVQKTDDGLKIQVHDNGQGFAQEWLDYGIRPFRTSHEHGTGLGFGNVRELRNVIERCVLFADGSEFPTEWLQLGKLTENATTDNLHIHLPLHGSMALDDMDKFIIQTALDRADNNLTSAARALGTTRETLRYRVRKYGLG